MNQSTGYEYNDEFPTRKRAGKLGFFYLVINESPLKIIRFQRISKTEKYFYHTLTKLGAKKLVKIKFTLTW